MIFFIFVLSNILNMGLITLSGMEFFAYHGCFAEEQIIGNKFIVDLEFFADTENAENTDDLSATVNYQIVYELVKAEMDIKSKLIEHVARRILDALYRQFPEIGDAKVTVSKLNPPLKGRVDKICFTLSRAR
jgi:dihydroneopterin aldolase